ncbi:hypothetical protein AB1Y20_007713 [Prymnesium parvum]|uniref:cGMP-dependent protein kinase n=1 Tax=Prymnesium parvum TaxID=97485 RepID=A0AB34IXZ1_PRYPA|mmetsp:Transcript_30609/g.70169  ORF Transcript_30609/g.70169 Transcript_30609/m.70169 type:complete len:872 (+) Transcript_30609:76-2691(+)
MGCGASQEQEPSRVNMDTRASKTALAQLREFERKSQTGAMLALGGIPEGEGSTRGSYAGLGDDYWKRDDYINPKASAKYRLSLLQNMQAPTDVLRQNSLKNMSVLAEGKTMTEVLAATDISQTSRRAVFAEGLPASTDGEFEPPQVVLKPEEVTAALVASMRQSVLFEHVDEPLLREIVSYMSERSAEKDEVVITEGEVGDALYVIGSGNYKAVMGASTSAEEVVATYSANELFGELALLYDSPRACTVICTSAGTLWRLCRSLFHQLVIGGIKKQSLGMEMYLSTVPCLAELTAQQRSLLAAAMQTTSFADGEWIIKEGEDADSLYLITDGEVRCTRTADPGCQESLKHLKQGHFFGESALVDQGAKRLANVQAVGAVTCAKLRATDVSKSLGDMNDVLRRNFNVKVIECIPLLKTLSVVQIDILLNAMEEVVHVAGDVIHKQGEEADFHILKSGKIRATKLNSEGKTEHKMLGAGSFFCETCLLPNELSPMTFVVESDQAWLIRLRREAFEAKLGPLREIMEEQATKSKRLAALENFQLSKFELKALIGIGTLAEVTLLLHRPTQRPYALKTMSKGKLIHLRQLDNVVREKQLLVDLHHPFICKISVVFSTLRQVCMGFEAVLGGELFRLIRSKGKFDLNTTVRYAANIVLPVQYLHGLKIIHRDLKPENFLIDADGYLKLIDFGFAKRVEDFTTWTLCGTPEYLAPEVIAYRGHNTGADWWSFGILLFEMLTGAAPFRDKTPMEVYQKILRGKFKFPTTFPEAAKDLIGQLLQQNPMERIGCWSRGAEDVKEHSFFANVDWKAVEERSLPAPHVPDISGPSDFKNFGAKEPQDTSQYDSYMDPTYNKKFEAEFGAPVPPSDFAHLSVS